MFFFNWPFLTVFITCVLFFLAEQQSGVSSDVFFSHNDSN